MWLERSHGKAAEGRLPTVVKRKPFYLEIPFDEEGHKREIAMLRKELGISLPV